MPWKKPANPIRVSDERLESEAHAPPPRTPLQHPPGSEGRIQELTRRAARREPLFDDCVDFDTGLVVTMARQKNGVLAVTGEVECRAEPGEERRQGPCWYERLRAMREKAHLKQRHLAERAGLPQSTIATLERGRNDSPTLWVLWRIADALCVSLDDLVGREVPGRAA